MDKKKRFMEAFKNTIIYAVSEVAVGIAGIFVGWYVVAIGLYLVNGGKNLSVVQAGTISLFLGVFVALGAFNAFGVFIDGDYEDVPKALNGRWLLGKFSHRTALVVFFLLIGYLLTNTTNIKVQPELSALGLDSYTLFTILLFYLSGKFAGLFASWFDFSEPSEPNKYKAIVSRIGAVEN